MKKFLILFLVLSLPIVGCTKKGDVLNKVKDKINTLDAYHMKGSLEIVNGEDIYRYAIDSSFKRENYFRVALKNLNNNHTQILLRNDDGVYVLTPSLNKSFKFQSEWPYNNSQIYLLQTILKDIEEDSSHKIDELDDGYIITSKVDYTNNKNLTGQKVYIDKNFEIVKVEVFDKDFNTLMKLDIEKINTSPNFSSDYFDIDSSLNVSTDIESFPVSKIESIIYPMYIPAKTYLTSQDKVKTSSGDRVILTFDGENPFMLIQEVSSRQDKLDIIPSSGTFDIISDAIGVISDNSVSWSSNGIDYYVTSGSLSEKELIEVANSVNVMPVGK